MKVKIQQFLFGANHSWSVVGKEIGRELLRQGHEVHFISTDGIRPEFLEPDLTQHIRLKPDATYDAQVSYTAMHNFSTYLAHGQKNRFGIWNYEFPVLPVGFAKYHQYTDRFLPSSTFFYDICRDNKIPENKMKMIPHGVDWERFSSARPMKLNTNKKIKFLMNFGQAHLRKNIAGTLDCFGKAFTSNDDVCLVIKGSDKKPTHSFEVSLSDILARWRKKYPHGPELLVMTNYIPRIEELYRACDCLFMLPCAEAFFFPALEMIASGGAVITSNYGGQLDFLSNDNAQLVSGRMIPAPKAAQYWNASPYSSMFEPNVDEAVEKLRLCASQIDVEKKRSQSNVAELIERYSWKTVVGSILGLCE